MATVQIPSEQRFVLTGVDWPTYGRLLRAFDQRHVRLTYDRGALELMTLSPEHECYKKLLGRLVEALTEELALPLASFGSMTFRRRRKKRGLEPDDCYWIASEPQIHGKVHINLRTDPPPDLALEIDVTHSSLDRLSIYAALNVAEVWRFDGQVLTFHVLGADGRYVTQIHSRAFPALAVADMARFLALRQQTDENDVVRQFRAWVRQHLTGGGSSPTTP
ncbi:MAG TPA: Uma2 family endonuclease [Gemmataceae bacterium]|jgi:Uma2 family endonuclease|nr:Uma2 family endonuclease [Gemmataceae bacterium]